MEESRVDTLPAGQTLREAEVEGWQIQAYFASIKMLSIHQYNHQKPTVS
jgi:hypothetical protein